MELKHLIFTGDTYGGFATITRISNIQQNIPDYKPEETMIVILGDAGLNFWLNNTDKKYNKLLDSMNYHIYCVRGNHEQRPELIKNMVLVNDENVNNVVYMEEVKGESVDFILSHTCPLSWKPTDLFLNGIDQSTVDKSMEVWLDELKDNVKWRYYLFGHYHADRIERPHVEQFYQKYEDVESIIARWDKYDKTGKLDWWLPKSLAFYE